MKIVFCRKIALLADKTDITEEIVRFTSHVVQLKNTLVDENSIGRKVDFILQEMNREVEYNWFQSYGFKYYRVCGSAKM